VVSGHEFRGLYRGVEVQVRLEVQRIEVVFPGGGGREARQFAASVDAEDADLDLALLSVGGSDLPFIPLGDSDALEAGDPVQALGFPFGRRTEVARREETDVIPQVSVSRGSVAALRASDEGEPRFIQTDATVNPGSSGGPLLDNEGYAVGVVRMKLARASGVGFAIPINRVKDFLETAGLGSLLPAGRLRLGSLQSFETKGLRLRLPEGLEDQSPTRLRVHTRADDDWELGVLIDRVATPQSFEELEHALLSGAAGPEFVGSGQPTRRRLLQDPIRALLGSANGTGHGGGPPLKLEYAIVDLGKEKLLARYLGPAPLVAFNRAVLRESLASLEADPLLRREIRAEVAPTLEPGRFVQPQAPPLLVPAGWLQEPVGPRSPAAFPPFDAAVSASPEGDFTVSFRAGWWWSKPETGPVAQLPYARRSNQLGVSYVVEGTFIVGAEGFYQLELNAPEQKLAFVRDLFRAWVGSFQSSAR
jgi:hypothetical protein